MKRQFDTKCERVIGKTRKFLANGHLVIEISHRDHLDLPIEKGEEYLVTIEKQ